MSKTTRSFKLLTLRAIGTNINEVVRSSSRTNEMVENFSEALISSYLYPNVKTTGLSEMSTPRAIKINNNEVVGSGSDRLKLILFSKTGLIKS